MTTPALAPQPLCFISPATVIGTAENIEIVIHRDGVATRLTASLAVAPPPALLWGDRVLVAVDGRGAWVIGVLDRPDRGPDAQLTEAPALRPERRLTTPSGASVALADDETIAVRDANDRLVFEYHADTGRGTITASGGLALEAPEGDIDLVAGGSIRCRGRDVALETARSSLALGEATAELAAPSLAVRSGRADLLFGQARYRGEQLSAVVERAKIMTSKIEHVAGWVIERAQTVLRRVEDLDQLEAGRTRTIVRGAHSVKAGRAVMTARDEIKIDGNSIHLG